MPKKELSEAETERLITAARLAVADEHDGLFNQIMKELGVEIDSSADEDVEVKPRKKK